jgi:AcrR family transcriptional regulator
MSETQDPIRQQLIEARRNQILDAAVAVFAEKGFHRATTKRIAEEAGIAEGTIYNYFESKGDLLVDMMTRLTALETLDGELTEALQGNVRDFFVAMFHQRTDHILEMQNVLQAIMPSVIADPEIRDRYYRQFVTRVAAIYERYVQARIEMGDLRPVDATLTTRILQSLFIGLFIMRILGDKALATKWEQVPELIATVIFDGLKAEGVE